MLPAVLLLAVAVRLIGIDHGLPALYDPDEGFFVITGLKMLRDHTLNPGWFGHPGTTTFYVVALIELAVIACGILTGRFADVKSFGQAIYIDPSIVIIPTRLFVVACSLGCVWITYRIAAKLFGERVAVRASIVLAIAPLHVAASQIVRTDVHATLFMLLALDRAVSIARQGRLRDYLLAALWIGLGCATKWPAAMVSAAVIGAYIVQRRIQPADAGRQVRFLFVSGIASIAALFVSSPYLFLDYATTFHNLGGEARPSHLGATGGSLLWNLGWYAWDPLRGSIGVVGLALAAIGVIVCWRNRVAAATLLAAATSFGFGIAFQKLIWARWLIPLLPSAAIFVALGATTLVDRVRAASPRLAPVMAWLLGIALLAPITITLVRETRERRNDTRQVAGAWAKAHIPSGSILLVEYFAFDLLQEPWGGLFPAGRLGCLDGRAMSRTQVRSAEVEGWRNGNAIVDIGTIDPSALWRCRADYAIFTDYDRYRRERARYPIETANYERLVRGGTVLLTVEPISGTRGGPTVRVVRLGPAFAPRARALL